MGLRPLDRPCEHCRVKLFMQTKHLGGIDYSSTTTDEKGVEHTVKVCRDNIKMQRNIAELALSRGRD